MKVLTACAALNLAPVMQVMDPSIKITMPPAPVEEEDEEAPKPKQTPGKDS